MRDGPHGALVVGDHFAYACPGDDLGAGLLRLGHVDQVEGRLGPCGQPHSQTPPTPALLKGLFFWLEMALVPGHQCHPSLFAASAAFMPGLLRGCGGSG